MRTAYQMLNTRAGCWHYIRYSLRHRPLGQQLLRGLSGRFDPFFELIHWILVFGGSVQLVCSILASAQTMALKPTTLSVSTAIFSFCLCAWITTTLPSTQFWRSSTSRRDLCTKIHKLDIHHFEHIWPMKNLKVIVGKLHQMEDTTWLQIRLHENIFAKNSSSRNKVAFDRTLVYCGEDN